MDGKRGRLPPPPDGYREILGVVAVGETPAVAIARAEAAIAEAARGEIVRLEFET